MRDLNEVQLLRKVALLGVALITAALMLVSQSTAEQRDSLELAGWISIGICIIGRTWSGLYIAGRKNLLVVRCGPYSVVRNPLYLFSVLGAIGIGLSSGSLVYAVMLGAIVLTIFHLVVLQEEHFLSQTLGADYRRYLEEVPRWVPDLSAWEGASELQIRWRIVFRIFGDALFFALAIPLLEALERLQDGGFVPVLLRLP